jgi:putative membrane protein
MKVKGLLLLLFILLMLVVVGFIGSQNNHLVPVNYILAETEIRMSVLLAVTFSLGGVFLFLIFIGYILRLKWRINSLERKNKKLSQPTNAL